MEHTSDIHQQKRSDWSAVMNILVMSVMGNVQRSQSQMIKLWVTSLSSWRHTQSLQCCWTNVKMCTVPYTNQLQSYMRHLHEMEHNMQRRNVCGEFVVKLTLFCLHILSCDSHLLSYGLRMSGKKKKQGMAQLWLNLHLMAVGVEGCTAPGPRHDQHEISWMENISSSRSVMTSFQTKQPRGQIASVLLSYINVDFFFSPTVGCCYADCPVAPHWTPRLILPGS